MKHFVLGFISGVMVTVSLPVAAATLVGGSGYLSGWSVTIRGREVCDTPYVWASIKEIEC